MTTEKGVEFQAQDLTREGVNHTEGGAIEYPALL